jgi:hypothetical protein
MAYKKTKNEHLIRENARSKDAKNLLGDYTLQDIHIK